jgi:hypothetical protein
MEQKKMEKKKMYDSPKVITGIIIFLLLLTSPILYNVSTGQASYVPELKIETTAKSCVEPTEFMRANHMDLLNNWRNDVVRGASRTYTAHNGKEYEKSLTNTCMSCHLSRSEFCNKCHDYAGVKQPKCWDCHNEPNLNSPVIK